LQAADVASQFIDPLAIRDPYVIPAMEFYLKVIHLSLQIPDRIITTYIVVVMSRGELVTRYTDRPG
jgi:hypothetical protein